MMRRMSFLWAEMSYGFNFVCNFLKLDVKVIAFIY